MLTSELIRAARMLLRWDQDTLSERSGVPLTTLKKLELREGPLVTRGGTEEKLRSALEEAGVEFLNHGQPGVRLQFIEAQPHQRDNGEWGVMARWRQADPVSWCSTEDAFKAAQEAEERGDIRLASALREAAEAATRHAKRLP